MISSSRFINLIKVFIFSLVLVLSVFSIITPYKIAYADNGTAICTAQTDASKNIGTCINRIYIISLAAGGTIAVLIFVIAGYMYMSGAPAKAKTMIYSAVSGLVILFSAFLLLNTINPELTTFTGLTLPDVTCGTNNALCAAPNSDLGNTAAAPGSGNPNGPFNIDGYDLSSYATSPNFQPAIQRIFSSVQGKKLSSPQDITNYMKNIASSTPLTGAMVITSAGNYGEDKNMIITLMQNDSSFGTQGLGAKTHNPGNVGNNDLGKQVDYGTWQDGVDAVAEFLSSHHSK